MGEKEKKINKSNRFIEIGNTTFEVTSTYTGTSELQDLIKRLIQKDIEYAYGS